MKTSITDITGRIIIGALIAGLATCFTACSEQAPLATDSATGQQGLNFIAIANPSAAPLGKMVTVSQMVTVNDGGELFTEVGKDRELLALINKTPALTSYDLAQNLLAASPLSPTVLIELARNNRYKNDYWTKEVFLRNSPLRTCILQVIIDRKTFTNSWDLQTLLVASSPLKDEILDQLDSIGMTRNDIREVRKQQGGKFVLDQKKNVGTFGVAVNFKVLPGAVAKDSDISISLDDGQLGGDVYLTFGPHGTTFNPPAILDIEASGVNFLGVDVSTISLYYDNQETGLWEPMEYDELIVHRKRSYMQVIGARLPHFSRYAFAWSR